MLEGVLHHLLGGYRGYVIGQEHIEHSTNCDDADTFTAVDRLGHAPDEN